MIKKKVKKENYFAEREEQAVVDYINTDSLEEKNRIYNDILKEPFRIMNESVLRVYPITIGNYEVDEVEKYALSHLIEQMVKFDKDRVNKSGNITKAYSYCQTIIRNYYIDHSKKSALERRTHLSYDDYIAEVENNGNYAYSIDDEGENKLEILIDTIVDKIKNRIENDKQLKKNEIMIGDAIVNVLNNWGALFLEDTPEGKFNKKVTNKFAKNKILFFLKEQTGLNTKEIRLAIKPFKEIYFIEKLALNNE